MGRRNFCLVSTIWVMNLLPEALLASRSVAFLSAELIPSLTY